MSNLTEETLGANDPTVPSGPRTAPSGLESHTLILSPTVPFEDLANEKLLSTAPRVKVGDKVVPALGSIPLLAKLGQGGMGAVYFGFHPRLKMDVAVKVLPSRLASRSPELIQRFFREAQIAAKVKSPHLVGVIDVNDEGGLFFLVMEYVSGVSAGSYLRKRKTGDAQATPWVDEATALEICIAATEGLAAAHSEGVIHRDIKPDNILIPKAKVGDALLFKSSKLADLGLARTDEAGPELTSAQSVMGTPGYMAPEQANDAKTAGKPADVFSMGASLYALLAGRAPFEGKAAMTIIVATIQTPHRQVTQINPGISQATSDLIDRCLQKDPAKRFSDAMALLEALQACRPVSINATAPAATLAVPAPEVPHHAANRTARRALFAGVALAVIGVLFLLGSQARQREVEKMLAEQKKLSADDEARHNAELAARSDEERKRAEDQTKSSGMLRETGLAAQGVAVKAATDAAHKADDWRNAVANEKRTRDDGERLQKELTDAQDAERKAATESAARAEDVKDARKLARLADENAQRFGTALAKKNARDRQDSFRQAEQNEKKAQEELSARQGAVRRAEDALKSAPQNLQRAIAERTKAEQAMTVTSQQAQRAMEGAQSAAKALALPPEKLAELMPLYKLADGSHAVETVDETFHDLMRRKDVPVRIYYPKEEGTWPLIVFSHGAFVSRENFYLLGQYWASHGYVCVHPTHADSTELLKQKDYGLEWLKSLGADPKNWENRVRDVGFIVELMARMRMRNLTVKGKVDPQHIGVAGHALGGFTAQLCGGATIDLPGEKGKSYAEKRIDAVLLLAPDGRFPQGLTTDSWKNFNKPMMDIVGSKDNGIGQSADWRQEPYKLSPSGDKFLAVIDDAAHGLGGIVGAGKLEALLGPDNPETRDWVKMASLAFWDAYLKEDPKARAWLRSNALQNASKGKVNLSRK